MIKKLSPEKRGWELVSHIPSLASSKNKQLEEGYLVTYSKGTSHLGITLSDIQSKRWLYNNHRFVYNIPEGIHYLLYNTNRGNFELKAIDKKDLDGFHVVSLEEIESFSAKEDLAISFTRKIAEYLIQKREQYWNEFNHDYSDQIIPMIWLR